MIRAVPVLVLVLVLVPGLCLADRTQVYSIQGADCASCAEAIKGELKKIAGVKKVDFDKHAVEITVKMDDGVDDAAILAGVARSQEGLTAVVGAGKGAYLPAEPFPAGADFRLVTNDGSAVGPLPKLAVAGKYTVFDVYADWCGPCRLVDARLREIMAARKDVAVRKLNVVSFESALAQELGSRLSSLPYVVVFTPSGKRIDIDGANMEKLDKALAAK